MSISCEFVFDNETYRCVIENVDFTNIRKIESFKGEHYRGLTNNRVNMVNFRHCKMEKFPKGVAEIFPETELLELFDCHLKEITKEDLRGFTNLAFFSAACNQLSSLPGNLFEFTPLLQYVDFSCNRITKIGSTILNPLEKFSQFVMKENLKFDIDYKEGTNLKKAAVKRREFVRFIKRNFTAMESLKDLAMMKLIDSVNTKNAVEIFRCSNQVDMIPLRKAAFEVVRTKIFKGIHKSLINYPDEVVKMAEERKTRER